MSVFMPVVLVYLQFINFDESHSLVVSCSKNGWSLHCFIYDGSSCCLRFADFPAAGNVVCMQDGGCVDLTW